MAQLKEWMKQETEKLKTGGIVPGMGIIRVGESPDDIAYENNIIRNCKDIGIQVQVFQTSSNTSPDAFLDLLRNVNHRSDIHGILIFRPLPDFLQIDSVKCLIRPQKDIDCIQPENLLKIFEGKTDGFAPCTPEAIIEMLKYYQIPLQGAHVVVINRSMVVGKPLAMMLLQEGATVTICHSKTKNLREITSQADIVITAVGKPKIFGAEYFHDRTTVIDVGINYTEDGKICGDVNYEEVYGKVQRITPVPGGVGGLTTAVLLKHVIEACKRQQI